MTRFSPVRSSVIARSPLSRRAALGTMLAALAVSFAGLGGCKDPAKESEKLARTHAESLTSLVEKDVLEVERGLPEGGKRLGPLFGKEEPQKNLPAVRAALQKVRRDVPDLLIAKSTFFAYADDAGIAVRNDLEQDAMAGLNLFSIFPDLQKAKEGFVTTTGVFPGAPGKAGPDRDFLAAAPVRHEDGKPFGVLVTGWTFRRFSLHLSETLKHDLQEKLLQSGEKGKMPVLYVGVFDKTGAYGAPQTPPSNEKTLSEMNLLEKTQGGMASGTLNLTDRAFGWAAVRTPKLGPDVGVFVLRSEI